MDLPGLPGSTQQRPSYSEILPEQGFTSPVSSSRRASQRTRDRQSSKLILCSPSRRTGLFVPPHGEDRKTSIQKEWEAARSCLGPT